MKWEKLVERKGDFLKNCLMYEGMVENFPKVHGRPHYGFLTIRKRDVEVVFLGCDFWVSGIIFTYELKVSDACQIDTHSIDTSVGTTIHLKRDAIVRSTKLDF